MVATTWISKMPGRCGGNACVRDSRITVWGIASYRQMGCSDEFILNSIQGLTAADLEAADEYAQTHPDEIAEAIRMNEEGEEGMVE